jgi:hypothetical protein
LSISTVIDLFGGCVELLLLLEASESDDEDDELPKPSAAYTATTEFARFEAAVVAWLM